MTSNKLFLNGVTQVSWKMHFKYLTLPTFFSFVPMTYCCGFAVFFLSIKKKVCLRARSWKSILVYLQKVNTHTLTLAHWSTGYPKKQMCLYSLALHLNHYRKIDLFCASIFCREETHDKDNFAVSQPVQHTAKFEHTSYLKETHGTLWFTAKVRSMPTANRSARWTAQTAHGKSMAHYNDPDKLTANSTAHAMHLSVACQCQSRIRINGQLQVVEQIRTQRHI
jgi:hypothetical protein